MKLPSTVLAIIVFIPALCSIENSALAQNSDEYSVDAGAEHLRFLRRPDLGYVAQSQDDPAALEALDGILRQAGATDIKPLRGLSRQGVSVVHSQRPAAQTENIIATLRRHKHIRYAAPLFSSNGSVIAITPEIVVKTTQADDRQLRTLCRTMNLTVKKKLEFTEREYLIDVPAVNEADVFNALEQLNQLDFVEWAVPNVAFQPQLLGPLSSPSQTGTAKKHTPPPPPDVTPLISETYSSDLDGNRIEDQLESKVETALARLQSAVTPQEKQQAQALWAEMVDVELIFKSPVTQQQIDDFSAMGGEISYIYKAVSYGWNGQIPLGEKQAAKLAEPEGIMADFEAGQSKVRVIVNLVKPSQFPAAIDWNSRAALKALQADVSARQREVLVKLTDTEFKLRTCFENQPGFAGDVTLNGLYKLLDDSLVESVERDNLLELHLAQGIPLINASIYRPTYNGQGVAVAICDSGIDYNHPRLGGGGFPNSKVIGGYDFGDNDPNPIHGGEAHGTSTAGIAAGNTGTVGDYIGGVAYNAKIYALKVEDSDGYIYDSYIVNAWNWCVTHKNDDPSNPILVISNSFGGGRYLSFCDSSKTALRDAANSAVAAGITLLVSSGNDGYCDSISSPACLSGVISVGAVYDAGFGDYYPCISSASCATKYSTTGCSTGFYAIDSTVADMVTSYSNTASFLNVLAPSNNAYTTDITGSGGYSSGDYYPEFDGTSAACPYAAGAVACLQSAAKLMKGSYLTPSEVKDTLVSTGDNITDGKVAITKPRVNLGRAIDSLLPPEQATNPNPSNGATNISITADLSWTAGSGATLHCVYLGTDSTPDETEFKGCQPGITYDPGTLSYNTPYYWRIDEKNAGGTTTGVVWSFTTAPAPPSQASNPSPADGATNVNINADLSWTAGSGATLHCVYFNGEFKGCQPGTTYDPGTLSYNTPYYWRIDEKNAGGTTTGVVWSFTTAPAPPSQASNPSPADGATNVNINADLSWTAGSGATLHCVYLATDYNDVNEATPDSPEFKGCQPGTTYDPGTLIGNITYYWRIDEKNISGTTTTGVVWSFTTVYPDDTYFPNQWHLHNTGQSGGRPDADIDAPEAWWITTGDPSIIVAVIDSGVDTDHPDLINNIVPGYDFDDNDGDPNPIGNDADAAHGTACAGLVAAQGNNGIGVTGVTWQCKIMPVRIPFGDLYVVETDLAAAIRWPAANGADILSNSWGWAGSYPSPVIRSAIQDVTEPGGIGRDGKGCIVLAASGNWSGGGPVIYPAKYAEVIAVGATNKNDTRWSYSAYGPELDIVAPSGNTNSNGDIWTTDIVGDAGYNNRNTGIKDYTDKMGGTSGACPIAAGVAALILSVDPNLTNIEVQDILQTSAVDLVGAGFDNYYGHGRVDAHFALEQMQMLPAQKWVARYNGPANSSDYAHALAVDDSGNVYVTGYSYGSGSNNDYMTIKYDPAGSQLWTARYNGSANDWDSAVALAVDGSGNVYVTGCSRGIGTSDDYATIKYSPSGDQLWVKRYNGTANSYDYPCALAVDDAGNVYVTGYSFEDANSYNYATIKYDADGNQLWEARYNGPGNYTDAARSLAVDSLGNVYVTGYSFGSGSYEDYATIKYDPNGTQVWVKRYNGPGNNADSASTIAMDNAGNVYVTGYSFGSGTGYDYATIKYDPAGGQVWVKRYNGSGNGSDYAYDLAVDGSSNVYVTGGSRGSGSNSDYTTVKYDPNGNQLWVKRYNGTGNGSDCATALAVDNSDNVYVAGYSYSSGNDDDYLSIKYDPNGSRLWMVRYNGQDGYADGFRDLAVDNLGNVYITGGSYSSGSYEDYATVKYGRGDFCPEPLEGDLDGNCRVDSADLALFADQWLAPFDFTDYAAFAENWLQ